MAAPKYLRMLAGKIAELAAITSSAGAGDGEKVVATGTDGKLDITLMPNGLTAEARTVTAFENLAAGDFVNVFDDAGTLKARKAEADVASSAKRAHGYVLAAATTGNPATVYYGNVNSQLAGLTIGSEYYLSETAGGVTLTPPSAGPNKFVQRLGTALSATELLVEIAQPIELA